MRLVNNIKARVARRRKQVAERALRRFESDARPLDRAGILAPSAFDTTRVRYIVLSLWRSIAVPSSDKGRVS